MLGVVVVDIACGGSHSGCIDEHGQLYTWGKGRYGRLGHGDSDDQYRPKQVKITCSLNTLYFMPLLRKVIRRVCLLLRSQIFADQPYLYLKDPGAVIRIKIKGGV